MVAEGLMPPKEADRLAAGEVAILKGWIKEGATWSGGALTPGSITTDRRAGLDWWSLRPIRRPVVPEVIDAGRVANPIDAFVQAEARGEGLEPGARGGPPDADPPADVRPDRPAADARGGRRLPADDAPERSNGWSTACSPRPTTASAGAALARRGPVRREPRLRARLPRPNAWRYRDYVIRASTTTSPTTASSPSNSPATCSAERPPTRSPPPGFLVAGPCDEVGQQGRRALMQANVRQDELEDMVGADGAGVPGPDDPAAPAATTTSSTRSPRTTTTGCKPLLGGRPARRPRRRQAERRTSPRARLRAPSGCLNRGDVQSPGRTVRCRAPERGPDRLGDVRPLRTAPEGDRRRALAGWIADAATR